MRCAVSGVEPSRRAKSKKASKESKVRKEMFITLEEVEANHRALRRCRSCGSYERVFDLFNGGARCERCAKRARREAEESESGDLTPTFAL